MTPVDFILTNSCVIFLQVRVILVLLFNTFIYDVEKWSLKILWCKHHKIFKVCLTMFQKQPVANVLHNSCSQKFSNIHRRTPVL